METFSCKSLQFEGFKFHKEDVELLGKFLKDNRCRVEELTLNEADLEDEIFQVIIDSLKESDNLKSLSLAKNQMPRIIC